MLKKILATFVATLLAAGLTVAVAAPAQAASSVTVTPDGVSLPGWARVADGATIAVRYTVDGAKKNASLHVDARRGPGKPYAGASYVPWSAVFTASSYCITWAQVSGVGTFGESGEKPVCTPAKPAPKPTQAPAPKPSPAPAPSPAAKPTQAPAAPTPTPAAKPTPTPSASPTPPAAQTVQPTAKSVPQTQTKTQTTTTYGVGLYLYQKKNLGAAASWENSGPQTLLLTDLDNTSEANNTFWDSLDASVLPAEVCGPGWAVQQDKVKFTGSFSFPTSITPPVSPAGFGWPPIYDARHSELSSLVRVPDCAPATAELSFTDATCTTPQLVALGAVSFATWGALSKAIGPGAYTVTATAQTGHTFADGSTTKVFSGTLAGVKTDGECAPPPPCIKTKLVSYTYNPATNSGTITVPTVKGSSGELCAPFWVTATSWKYLGTTSWAQKLDVVQKLGPISESGEYPFVATVGCGQGDIYASYSATDPTLDPTPYLNGPDNPFDEHFLHEMGFYGPNPTFTTRQLGCNTLTAEPSFSPPICTAPGQYTLPDVEHVQWYVNGTPVSADTYTAAAGSKITITAVAEESWVLKNGSFDTTSKTWSFTWKHTFETPTCADPTLTGSITVECRNDSPWIDYSVTLVDPDHMSTGTTARLTLSEITDDPDAESYSYPPLGEIHNGETLTGSVLWIGATQADLDGDGVPEPTGWPGWELVDGEWTNNPATNYGWTRPAATATISVNPEISQDLEYPPSNPDCGEPRIVEPEVSSTPLSCDASTSGTYTLSNTPGVVWTVDGTTPVEPGTYSVGSPKTVVVTAVLDQSDGPVRFADGAQRTWTLPFTAPSECLTLDGSAASSICINDSPWIDFTVELTDPYNLTTGHTPSLTMTSEDGLISETFPLTASDGATQVAAGTPFVGHMLWPGASVDAEGNPTGWPGWELVDGEWQPTTGNYDWTRGNITAKLEVNPEIPVMLSYPGPTADCFGPDIPTLATFPTNATLAQQCTTDGRGVLTLGQVDGVSFFDDVNYFVDGVPAASQTVLLSKGTHRITATVKDPEDGLDGPSAWSVTVTGAAICGELTTLALTGANAPGMIALAALLLAAGAAVMIGRRLRLRRSH